jgi:hypothetical protein
MGMIEETIYRFTLTAADTKLTTFQGARLRLRFEVAEWLNLNGHMKKVENTINAIIVEFSDASAAVHFKMRFVEGDDSFS